MGAPGRVAEIARALRLRRAPVPGSAGARAGRRRARHTKPIAPATACTAEPHADPATISQTHTRVGRFEDCSVSGSVRRSHQSHAGHDPPNPPTFGRIRTGVGRHRAEIGRNRQKLTACGQRLLPKQCQVRPTCCRVRAKSHVIAQKAAIQDVGRIRPELEPNSIETAPGLIWPKSVQIRPKSPRFGPTRPTPGRSRSEIGRNRPSMVESGAHLAQAGPNSAGTRQAQDDPIQEMSAQL